METVLVLRKLTQGYCGFISLTFLQLAGISMIAHHETGSLVGNEEIEKLKEEAKAYEDHMLQYKSIVQVNKDALKQIEGAHENFKMEAEKLKRSLEAELHSLRERISELENESCLKSEEVASAAAGKEDHIRSKIVAMEIQISALKEDLEIEHQRWLAAQANYERQVILQSETIQELNKTSRALALVQEEASEMRKLEDTYKSENNELKAKWYVEKAMQCWRNRRTVLRKITMNSMSSKILHSRLEALHIQLAEKDHISSGLSSGSASPDTPGDAGLQNVINYLRRSKEIAETEISLLKHEKLRLQSQLESALKAAETAQSSLHAERASSRSLLLTEDEIKSLQLQVIEMNLLRESNVQLREENKHNFEECQKLREIPLKANIETENLERLLNERQIEVEACRKEIEMQKLDNERLEKRVSELVHRGYMCTLNHVIPVDAYYSQFSRLWRLFRILLQLQVCFKCGGLTVDEDTARRYFCAAFFKCGGVTGIALTVSSSPVKPPHLDANWKRGLLYAVLYLISQVTYNILLAKTLEIIPDPLAITGWTSLCAVSTNAFIDLITESRTRYSGFKFLPCLRICTYLYGGFIIAISATYIEARVTKHKGIMVLQSFKPLCVVFVVILSTAFLGQHLVRGRIVGALPMFSGLTLLLLGRSELMRPQVPQVMADNVENAVEDAAGNMPIV
ncbi:hypothetical protein FNV43_RR01095 [Rhamnella rubrinervis]|uniref:Nucleoprotein TPR/MLP1-2 domain-containing protein n=1 Tax=Rhamnella rubrinervis TaxID=2594499 RepID=A0A8K0HPW2_9ROSA|nr:hypothetical protein FNV43_RR01095 [Rhamnella rubrinervis]